MLDLVRRDGVPRSDEIVRTGLLSDEPDYGHLPMKLFRWSELEALLTPHGTIVGASAAGLLPSVEVDEPELADFLVRTELALAEEPGAVASGQHILAVLRKNAMKTLAIYLMSGPDTPELAEAAVEGGADLVELGFPFSDPLADGPVIRQAAERALAQGMRTAACLECLARTRERVDVPLVPMTYASLLEAYGYERFATDAEAAGATSLIVADLPAGERPDLRRIQLVAPTSTDERLELAADQTDGWLYLVTLTGTTGARDRLSPQLAGLMSRARALTDVPLYAGFGISTPEHAQDAAALADGVVVGSRAVEVAEDGPAALRDYVRSLRTAIDAAVPAIID